MSHSDTHTDSHAGSQGHGSHSYYDWQVSTLMLAYDTVEPLGRDDNAGLEKREKAVQRELYDLVHALLPEEYLKNPQSDFPPEVVTVLTRGTIARAAQIMGMTDDHADANAGNPNV